MLFWENPKRPTVSFTLQSGPKVWYGRQWPVDLLNNAGSQAQMT